MNNNNNLPYLMNREQASEYLGVDPNSFDKYVRSNKNLKRFMIGTQERYIAAELEKFINLHSIQAN